MKRYFCDRCEKEIPIVEHEQVEIAGKRYDLCRSTSCRETFAGMRSEAQKAVESYVALSRKAIADLEAKFLRKEPDGSA